MTHGIDAVVTRGSNTYGPYPPPREADPAVRHERDRRPAAADVRRRPPAARLAVRVATMPARIDHVLRHGATGETYNVPGRREMANRDVDRGCSSSGSASRGRSSGPSRTGPATTGATRWTARSWRRSAGATATVVRGRPGGDGRLVRRQRGLVAGRPVRRLGRLLRAPVRAARLARRRPRPDGAGRVDRRRRPARAGPLVAALEEAPFTGPLGPIAWTRAIFDLDAPDGDRARCSIATGPRSSSTPRPGPTSTAAPASRSSRCAATGSRPGSSPRPAPSAAIDLIVVSTNEVFDGRRTDGRRLPAGRSDRARSTPYGAVEARGRAAPRSRGLRRDRRGGARDRPDGLAVRPARQRLPAPRSSPPRTGPRRPASRSALVGDEIGHADLHRATSPRRSSSCIGRRRHRRGPPPRQRRRRDAGPTGRATPPPGRCRGRRSRTSRRDLAARLDAAARGASSTRRRCPCGEPLRPWQAAAGRLPAEPPPATAAAAGGRPPTTSDRSSARAAALGPAGRPLRRDRAARRQRGAFRELWRAGASGTDRPADAGAPAGSAPRFVQANLSSSAAGVLRGLHSTAASSTTGSSASRPRVRGPRRRPAGARRAAGRPSSRPASSRPTSGSRSRPAWPTASSPSSRSSSSTSSRTSYDGSDELGFAWDDPLAAVPVAGRSRARPTAARSCPIATAPTRRSPSSWRGCAPDPER